MADKISAFNSNGSYLAAQSYLPEPATGGMGLFKDVFSAVGAIGGALLQGAAGSIGAAGAYDPTGPYTDLLNTQMRMQEEMQVTNMVSNIEKSKHESKMAPIRNIRVG